MKFNEKSGKYISVRLSKGGGVRQVEVNCDICNDLIVMGKELFFPGLKTLGKWFNLGSYSGEIIDCETFLLENYIEVHKLTRVRLYLLYKNKSKFDTVTDLIESDRISDEEILPTLPKG